MKFISLLMTFCISLNVMAANGSIEGLEQAFNDYQYSITVDWNQEDESFKKEQTNLFFNELERLISQGLNNQDITDFVEKKVSNAKAFTHLQTEMNALALNATSAEDLAEILNNHSSDFYQQGASWTASRAQVAGIVIAISALFVYGVFFNLKFGCVQTIDGVKSYCTDDPSYNHF